MLPKFDLLRAKIEFEAPSPHAIAITSATGQDGRQAAARGLADSLVAAGYATLLLDTCLTNRTLGASPQRLTLEEAGQLLAPEPGSRKLSVLKLGNLLLQKATSQRHLQSALKQFRAMFDYVIMDTDYYGSPAFALSVIASADSVLATLQAGRKGTAEDSALANVLNQLGPRFLGVITLDRSLCTKSIDLMSILDSVSDWRATKPAFSGRGPKKREII